MGCICGPNKGGWGGLLGVDFLFAHNFVFSADIGLQLGGKIVTTEVQGLIPRHIV